MVRQIHSFVFLWKKRSVLDLKKINIISHIVIWSSFFVMTLFYLKAWLDSYGKMFSLWEIAEYTVLYQGLLMYVPIFNQVYLVRKFYFKKRYLIYSLILTLLFISTGFVFMWIDDLYLDREEFPWMYTFPHWASRLPFQIMFVFVGNWFELSRKLQRKERLELQKQKEHAEAELKWLIAQVNPHFLFNALNNINSLIFLQRPEASTTLVRLSDLLKYIIQEGRKKRVAIALEAEHLKNYYAISTMKKRWGNKIELHIELANPYLQIPPLLFINFVENSIKHCNLDEEHAFIKLNLRSDADTVYFHLANTFNPQLIRDHTRGIGIENVKKRLHILFPHQHELDINQQGNTYSVHLKLSVIHEANP